MTSSSPSSTRSPVKVLVITLGGERRARIEDMFASPKLVDPATGESLFTVSFIPGVVSRSLRSKPGMMREAYECGLLTEDPETTFLAGKKGTQKGLWLDMDYAEELWRKGRSLNRERSVLACLMAHLKAMRAAVEGDYDVILEDNVRILESPESYEVMRSFIAKAGSSGVRYFGYLGPRDNLEWLYGKHLPRYEENEAPFPFTEHYNGEEVRGTSLWGAYAYMVSKEAYDAILKKVRR